MKKLLTDDNEAFSSAEIISEIPGHYKLAVSDIDIEDIEKMTGIHKGEFGGFFLKITDGEIMSLYGFYGGVPWIRAAVEHLIHDGKRLF